MAEVNPPVIQTASVLVDAKKPFLKVKTRWEYLEDNLEMWKNYLRYQSAAYISGFIGAILLVTTQSVIALPFIGGATYFWKRMEHAKSIVASNRVVMLGH